MTARLTPERETGIAARTEALNSLGLPDGTWTASPRDEKSVLPPEMAYVVEDVLRTKHSLLRSSVGVFGDVAHAEFAAHAREDVNALLAELAAVRAELDGATARVAGLDALISAGTEFRVWEPGYGLYVRRAPGGTGFAVLEAQRTLKGRRVWTSAGWQYMAVLSSAEVFCWPDAESAVAEARRIMPGATVAEAVTS